MSASDTRTIAIVGGGCAGRATLINTVAKSALGFETTVLMLDGLGLAEGKDVPYELNGIEAKDLHPFDTGVVPENFMTFGAYVEEYGKDLPSLLKSRSAPTYGQVAEYLSFMVNMAIVSFPFTLEVAESAVKEIDKSFWGQGATITFVDGTRLKVKEVIYAELPKQMGGPERQTSSTQDKPPATSKAATAANYATQGNRLLAAEDFAGAEEFFAQALVLYRELDDQENSGVMFSHLGDLAALREDVDEARSNWGKALVRFTNVGKRESPEGKRLMKLLDLLSG